MSELIDAPLYSLHLNATLYEVLRFLKMCIFSRFPLQSKNKFVIS